MTRIINLVLLVAIVVGLVQLTRHRGVLRELQSEYDRLSEHYEPFDVKDPSKFVIARVETGDRTHFLWQVYCPPGSQLNQRVGFAGTPGYGSSAFATAGEYLHRCHFELKPDRVLAHVIERSGSQVSNLSRSNLPMFVMEHWDELEFQVMASEMDVVIDPNQVIEFLTIRIPESLKDEFVDKVGAKIARQYTTRPLFEMLYGTPEAFEVYDKGNQNDQ